MSEAPNIPLGPPTDYASPFTWDQIKKLQAKLSSDLVAERSGLSYIEGHVAIRHMNEIFGIGNWERTLPVFNTVWNGERVKDGKTQYVAAYTCTVGVTIYGYETLNTPHGQETRRTALLTTYGTGYGEGITGVNPGQAHESAIKEAETDAMKRAMIVLGNQFGLKTVNTVTSPYVAQAA